MLKKSFFHNKFLQAFLFGAISALAFAPIYLFICLVISVLGFFYLLEKCQNAKESTFVGISYGFGYFLTGIYWISISLLVDAAQFAWLIPFCLTLIPLVLALYFALLSFFYHKINHKFSIKSKALKIFIFAILWILFEVLRSILFSGFPWNLIGYSLMFSDYAVQSASIFGIYGLSFLTILNCLSPTLFYKTSIHDKIFGTLFLLIFAANYAFGLYRIQNTKLNIQHNVILRMVQGNIKQDLKWSQSEKYNNILSHINLTREKSNSKITAIIWPETAVPYAITNNSEIVDFLKHNIPQEAILITGAIRISEDTKNKIEAWNDIFVLDKNGVLSNYDKQHLVPFGEYIPLAKFFPFIAKITNGEIGFSAGTETKTIHTKEFSFNPLICYEAIFSNNIINNNERPDLLINITNDAWFGNSSGPYQHFDMVRMRAIEYGMSLARVANSGITAYVDPFGRVVKKIDLNETNFIDVELIDKIDETFFSRMHHL